MSDETPDIEEDRQEEIENAHGRKHFFRGKPLEPFSFERQAAFQRIGVGSESILESAAAVIFLCSLGDGKTGLDFNGRKASGGYEMSGIDFIDSARGAGVITFRRLLAKWATENGIALNSPEGQEAVNVASEIWAETRVSKFEPIQKGGGKGGGRTVAVSKERIRRDDQRRR